MANRPRYRRYENDSRRAAPNDSVAAPDGRRVPASNWAAYLRRRLRALASRVRAPRAGRPSKAEGEKGDLPARLLRKGATLLTAAVVVVITSVLLSDVINGNKVVIKPFQVSPELKDIYDDEVVAHLIKHNISVMMYEANSLKASGGFDLPVSAKLPDVQVPAANISVKSLMRYVHEFVPLRYLKRLAGLNPIEVDGEALLRGDKVTINLRLTRDEGGVPVVEPKTFTGSRDNLEPLIKETSQFIMAYAEPYLWAVYLYQTRRTDEALAQVQYCLRKEPAESRHMALALWGLILIDQEKYREAIDKLEEATKYVPKGRERELATAYNNWGLALLYECKTEEAIPKFEEAIRHAPDHAYAYNNYGKAFLDRADTKGDREETRKGVEQLEQALKLDPNLATAYYNLAYAQADEKPYDAVALYLEAIKLNPEYVDAYSGLGLVLTESVSPARPDEALEKLNRAIELDKSFAPAYANRALAWASKGDFKRAIADGEAGVRLYENLSQARRGCGNFKHRQALAYNNLGWFYEKEMNYPAAVANYDKATQLDPDFHYAYTGKGDALRKAGRSRAALAAYEVVIREPRADENSRVTAYAGAGEVFRALGRLDEALAAYQSVLGSPKADEEKRFAAYKGGGEALLRRSRGRAPAERRGDLELSVSMFDEALKIRPDAKDVQAELSRAKGALELLTKKTN